MKLISVLFCNNNRGLLIMWGKVFGFCFGFMFGKFIGVLLGLYLGYMFDCSLK